MNSLIASAFLAVLALSPAAIADGPDGADLYQPCIACHGAAAAGNPELNAPALAGQDAGYLQRQLEHFRDGVRGGDPRDTTGAQMAAFASGLAQEQMASLASYLSALPPPEAVAQPAGDLRNGNDYYQSKCGACHGGRAQGNPGLNSPALAWLDAGYLKHQFRNFQQGVRGTHAQDTYGRQMKMMSTSLPSDKDLDDVIAYINSMAVPPR